MNIDKKRKNLNRMNTTAQMTKLGDTIPMVFQKKLVSGDISSGVATVDTASAATVIASALVIAADGTVRAITKIENGASAGKFKLSITSVAAGDTVTLVIL